MKRRTLAALGSLTLARCAAGGDQRLTSEAPLVVRPAPLPTPTVFPPVRFPDDEAPHDVLAEWWYYTGHLRDLESGGELGFELVFFRGVRGERPPGYAAHFAITDVERQRFVYDQRQDVALREAARVTASALGNVRPPGIVAVAPAGGGFDLLLGGWSMRGVNGNDALRAEAAGYAMDATLIARKPAALHFGSPPLLPGLVSFGPAGYSYYYSRTRMELSGSITVDGRQRRVGGEAWMDHQWGDFLVLGGGGWDWIAVTLDDGREVTISVIREDSGAVAISYGTLVDGAGRAHHLSPGSFDLRPTGSWVSTRTRITYPSGWRLAVADLDVILTPLLQDQELDTRASTGVIYWEGAVMVTNATGARVGKGYVELTGYK